MTSPRTPTFKIFISRAGVRAADRERLVRLLDARPDFRWEDLSPAPGADLAEQRRRMRAADAVLLLSPGEPAQRAALEAARALGRPIIAVAPRGERTAAPAVRRLADEVVGWNGELLVDSIRQYAIPAA